MKIQTTSAQRGWLVIEANHTPEEVTEYVENMSTDEIRRMAIVYEDCTVNINGLVVAVPDLINRETVAYSGKDVWAYEYFPDRGKVEIQYYSHPLDDPEPNSIVDASEFSEFIEGLVEEWKEKMLERLARNAIV